MRCFNRIPLLVFIYAYTFSKILFSHQADGNVTRLVRMNNFLVVGRNPLNLEKCPDGSEFVYLQAFGVCKKNVNFLNEETKVWFPLEHKKPSSGTDTEDTLTKSNNPLLRAYYGYCKPNFDKSEKCTLSINKDGEGADRFRTEFELDCANQGQSLFNGALFCIEKTGSPVQDGEVVSLVGFKGLDIEPRCPEDRKIQTVTAFELSSPLVNKGLINSFYDEASKKCDGHEQCSLSVTDEGRFKKYRVFTYKCVEP
ncbi:conserved hypothetical protein [Theileria orientalis strain Shintoku]|uniref:SUEL-type lectin domain-containing protein n=1 Tax=Theileria orientalis strain Shintoku TaxID=869250 RepID=J4D653_THEOR|nr:conserved hypothetical protein [Theileria orientalis strain Shintoku]BAM39345.1 conserved hypothetical protein [Theileria orientalis strain Shintoku]|eukprot:XP_009689646.1 conserved hypothetical protein [Theileria orientalis strain Shintoku]